MKRSNLIAGGALALALAALLVLPAWLGASESTAAEAGSEAPAPRGYLGVELRQLTPELQAHFGASEGSGVLVASLDEDSPAAAAGIRVGDVITAVDALAVDSPRDLSREVRHRPGESVDIEIVRDGRPRRVTATLAERRAHGWSRDAHWGGRGPEEWAELAEHWERWGEEIGQRWGEEFAERWGEEHAESWQRWAEEMAERGEGWEEMGEEIGRTVEKALSEIDWEEIGRSVEESMKAMEGVDWQAIGERIELHMEALGRRLEEPSEPAPSEE